MAGGARKPANDEFEIPNLDMTDPLAPKSSGSETPMPPPPSPSNPPSSPRASPYAGGFDDEVVDRGLSHEPISVSMTRAKAPAINLTSSAPPPPIELGHAISEQPFAPRRHDVPKARRSALGTVANVFIVGLGFAGAAAPLVRFAHHASGWKLPSFFHYALDGGSAVWSGSASMATLALTIVLAIMGTYARPRSYGYLLASLGMLLVAISCIVITFTVSPAGPPEIPPDGARLVPWVAPAVPLGIGLRLLRNAWAKCEEGNAGARLKGFCIAALSAATIFLAVELGFGLPLG
jgi:hypothetical protein